MVSLVQAQAVQKLKAEGWVIVEPTGKRPSRPGEFHPESLSRVESRRGPGFE